MLANPSNTLGIPATSTVPALQTDSYAELVNKLSWALGTTYRTAYSGKRSVARTYATLIARAVVRDHGYPRKIASI